MRINHNIAALNTYNKLQSSQTKSTKNKEKLSSGLRINRAGDDAAGLAISEKMRGQIRGLEKASTNAQDGISLIQTAEGALNETHEILQRMRELCVQGATDTYTDEDRVNIQSEVDELTTELNNISDRTQFNEQVLLDGTFFGVVQVGANSGQTIEFSIGNVDSTSLGMNVTQYENFEIVNATGIPCELEIFEDPTLTGAFHASFDKQNNVATITLPKPNFSTADRVAKFITDHLKAVGINITITGKPGATVNPTHPGQNVQLNTMLTATTQGNASHSITIMDRAIQKISAERSNLGAIQNRLEHTINNLGTSAENLTSAESRIRDVDMAKEMMELTKNNVLEQASQAMSAQANQTTQNVLQLLK